MKDGYRPPRDDVKNSWENRISFLLFGLLLIKKVRRHLLISHGFNEDFVVFKPNNQWGGLRPDFAVGHRTDSPQGYIEIELHEDQAQLEAYRSHTNLPVVCIGGPYSQHADAKLPDLANEIIEISQTDGSEQFKLMARHFKLEVDAACSGSPRPVRTGLQDQANSPLGKALYSIGALDLPAGKNASRCQLYVNTLERKGLSIRAFSPISNAQNSFSIAFIQGGSENMQFASYAHLTSHMLSDQQLPKIESWLSAVSGNLGLDLRLISGHGGSIPVASVYECWSGLTPSLLGLTHGPGCSCPDANDEA